MVRKIARSNMPGWGFIGMRKSLWLTASAALLSAAIAGAPTIARAQNTQPTWSGVYVGANVGDIVNHDTGSMVVAGGRPPAFLPFGWPFYPVFGELNSLGLLGGVQIGYNWQAGRLVIGPELDYDGSALSGHVYYNGVLGQPGHPLSSTSITSQSSESLTYFQTERLRIGYAVSRSTLVYITGGAAQGHWNLASTLTVPAAVPPTVFAANSSVTRGGGWTEGLGAEWALAPRVSLKVEGLLYDMQPPSRTVGLHTTTYLGKDFYFHGTVMRVGVNWKL
jgi:outer membrane immunogenic protein